MPRPLSSVRFSRPTQTPDCRAFPGRSRGRRACRLVRSNVLVVTLLSSVRGFPKDSKQKSGEQSLPWLRTRGARSPSARRTHRPAARSLSSALASRRSGRRKERQPAALGTSRRGPGWARLAVLQLSGFAVLENRHESVTVNRSSQFGQFSLADEACAILSTHFQSALVTAERFGDRRNDRQLARSKRSALLELQQLRST